MSESEFGRGYATCLRQFVNHRARLEENLVLYGQMAAKRREVDDFYSDEHGVEIWANGASDHLYELIRPVRGLRVVEWAEAKLLQERAIEIGHGFGPNSKSDPDEARSLLRMAERLLEHLTERGYDVSTLDAALATDRALGLKPEAGSWSCAEDIERMVPA